MFDSISHIISIRALKAFLICLLIVSTTLKAQDKYKRTFMMKDNHFQHVAAFYSGNAIIFIDRDSLVQNLNDVVNYSDYYETTRNKIRSLIDTILILAEQSDITIISSLTNDPEVTGITLSYYSKCILNKMANVYDKRKKEFVKKIIVKKSAHSSRSFSAYAWYYYFLPDDKNEFMHRVDKVGKGVKFL
jgi:hypothetical protein